MKSLIAFIATIIISTGLAKAQFTTAELQVSGLTCSMCSKATEKTLSTLPFIDHIKADLNHNVFFITFKSNTPVIMAQVMKKVQDAGFSINKLKAAFNFAGVRQNHGTFNYAGQTFIVVNNNNPLQGPVPLTFVDKGYAPASVYKKYTLKATANPAAGKVYRVII